MFTNKFAPADAGVVVSEKTVVDPFPVKLCLTIDNVLLVSSATGAPLASNFKNLFARLDATGSSIEIESESVIGLRID